MPGSNTELAVRVIPCLDVDAGRVVKGVNFDNLRDAGDPVELAAVYDAQGADELTFLDVTASSSGRATTFGMSEACATAGASAGLSVQRWVTCTPGTRTDSWGCAPR